MVTTILIILISVSISITPQYSVKNLLIEYMINIKPVIISTGRLPSIDIIKCFDIISIAYNSNDFQGFQKKNLKTKELEIHFLQGIYKPVLYKSALYKQCPCKTKDM